MNDPEFIQLLKQHGYELRSNKDLNSILNAMKDCWDLGYEQGRQDYEPIEM